MPTHIIKLLKTKDKRKILKAARGKRYLIYWGKNQFEWQQMCHQKTWRLKEYVVGISRAKKKLSTQNSIPSKNIHQE